MKDGEKEDGRGDKIQIRTRTLRIYTKAFVILVRPTKYQSRLDTRRAYRKEEGKKDTYFFISLSCAN